MYAMLRCGGNLPTGRIFSSRNGPREEVSKYKKRGSD